MSQGRRYSFIAAGFVTTLIISNLIAVKLIAIGPLLLPAAVIIFPISYIFGDILTEVYGYARARQVIWTGFFWNLFAVAAIWAAGLLPAAPIWAAGTFTSPDESQRAYEAIFGFAPRLLAASFIAYLFGEFLNSFVLAKMKLLTQGKYLWARTIGSTLVGQLADSAIFLSIAFVGTMPVAVLGQLILTQWLFKALYETVATPLTYLVVNYLKRTDNVDHFDRDTNFSPLG